MRKYFNVIFLVVFLFSGCSNIPSTEEIDKDITLLDKEINDAKAAVQKYSEGLLSVLTNVRLETLKTTKTMLEQKKKSYKRFIPVAYTIAGKKYSPPENKNDLLKELSNDLKKLQEDLAKVEEERAQYGGGLLGVFSLTQVATVKSSIAFLEC